MTSPPRQVRLAASNCRHEAPARPPTRRSWVESLSSPRRTGALAAIDQALVQPKRSVAPEFDLEGSNAEAGPKGRPRDFRERVLRSQFGDALFELPAFLHGPRLRGRPGADLTVLWPACEIGVGLRFADPRHRTADADLLSLRLPVKAERRERLSAELDALGAFQIGVEDKTVPIDP